MKENQPAKKVKKACGPVPFSDRDWRRRRRTDGCRSGCKKRESLSPFWSTMEKTGRKNCSNRKRKMQSY